MIGRVAALALAGMLLGACAFEGEPVGDVVSSLAAAPPTPARFSVCYAHGCKAHAPIHLDEVAWASLAARFAGPDDGPATERRHIAEAIQALEMTAGLQAGLDGDLGGSFPGMGRAGQLDCVDEMANVSTYLMLLDDAGLLRHYRPGRRLTSSFFGPRGAWTHTVATIVDRKTGAEYVIDTWVEDHGVLPYVTPVADWRAREPLTRDF